MSHIIQEYPRGVRIQETVVRELNPDGYSQNENDLRPLTVMSKILPTHIIDIHWHSLASDRRFYDRTCSKHGYSQNENDLRSLTVMSKVLPTHIIDIHWRAIEDSMIRRV